MKHLRLVLATLFLSAPFIATSAHAASLLLEPYIGYATGNVTQGTTTSSMTGVTYGGRVGLQNMGFQIGADYLTGNWNENSTPSATITPSDLGVFVGFKFPVMLRIYGEYVVQAQAKGTVAGASDTDKGTGFKAGIGYTGLPFIAINLEYLADTFTKDDNGTLNPNTTDKMYLLTVSLPLTLP